VTRQRLNLGQRVVLVVALGVALLVFGQWLIGFWEFGSRGFGRAAYAPLSSSSFQLPRIMLDSWVILIIWLILISLWMVISLFILRSHRGDESHP
jgi:hypothetical protein